MPTDIQTLARYLAARPELLALDAAAIRAELVADLDAPAPKAAELWITSMTIVSRLPLEQSGAVLTALEAVAAQNVIFRTALGALNGTGVNLADSKSLPLLQTLQSLVPSQAAVIDTIIGWAWETRRHPTIPADVTEEEAGDANAYALKLAPLKTLTDGIDAILASYDNHPAGAEALSGVALTTPIRTALYATAAQWAAVVAADGDTTALPTPAQAWATAKGAT